MHTKSEQPSIGVDREARFSYQVRVANGDRVVPRDVVVSYIEPRGKIFHQIQELNVIFFISQSGIYLTTYIHTYMK